MIFTSRRLYLGLAGWAVLKVWEMQCLESPRSLGTTRRGKAGHQIQSRGQNPGMRVTSHAFGLPVYVLVSLTVHSMTRAQPDAVQDEARYAANVGLLWSFNTVAHKMILKLL